MAISAVFNQEHFVILQDTEPLNHSPLSDYQYAAPDTNYNVPVSTKFRIRFETANTGGTAGGDSIVRRLRWSKDGGAYQQITTNSSDDVYLVTTTYFNNGDACSTQLLAAVGTFLTTGQGLTTASDTSQITFAGHYNLEDEFCIKFNSAAAGHTYTFQMYNVTGAKVYDTYTYTPSIAPTGGGSVITGIGATTGTPQYNSTLTEGLVSPGGATYSSQWYRCATYGGTYSAISGATGTTYTPVSGDIGYYIEVIVTGTGSYTGTATSTPVGPVRAIPLTSIGATNFTYLLPTYDLTAGSVSPGGATYNLQWRRSTSYGGTYSDIAGATSSTYNINSGDEGYYIVCQATGYGNYSGVVTSTPVGPVITPYQILTAYVSGKVNLGQTLAVNGIPYTSIGPCQWYYATSFGGMYNSISGATGSSYVIASPVAAGNYIKCQWSGSFPYYQGVGTTPAVGAVGSGYTFPLKGIQAII